MHNLWRSLRPTGCSEEAQRVEAHGVWGRIQLGGSRTPLLLHLEHGWGEDAHQGHPRRQPHRNNRLTQDQHPLWQQTGLVVRAVPNHMQQEHQPKAAWTETPRQRAADTARYVARPSSRDTLWWCTRKHTREQSASRATSAPTTAPHRATWSRTCRNTQFKWTLKPGPPRRMFQNLLLLLSPPLLLNLLLLLRNLTPHKS